jgi:hypothetical protein
MSSKTVYCAQKALDIGSLQATKREHKTIPLPPIIGILALAGGVVVLVTDRNSN